MNMKGVTFHLTSSYATAGKTGLVSEPSQALGLKAVVNYTAPSGLVVSGYYNLKDTQNDNNAFTDKAVASPLSYTQDISRTVQSAGASFSYQPTKGTNLYASLDWMRLDASVLFFESNRRRFESTTTFALRDLQGSVVDNTMFSVGGDYQASDRLKWSGAYSVTSVDGNLASGTVANQLSAIDDSLDSLLHSVVVEAVYDLSKTRKLRVGYRYDKYEDSAYPLLSGGAHSLMVGLTFML
jgi:predicted porin